MSKLFYSREKIFFWYWLPFFIYAAFIFYLSSLSIRVRIGVPNFDKVMHLGEYLVFGILFSRALQKSFPQKKPINYYFLIILVTYFYGASDEIHQLFVPYREFSFFDLLADITGAAIGGKIYGFRVG